VVTEPVAISRHSTVQILMSIHAYDIVSLPWVPKYMSMRIHVHQIIVIPLSMAQCPCFQCSWSPVGVGLFDIHGRPLRGANLGPLVLCDWVLDCHMLSNAERSSRQLHTEALLGW
jgi:hypothetical protein